MVGKVFLSRVTPLIGLLMLCLTACSNQVSDIAPSASIEESTKIPPVALSLGQAFTAQESLFIKANLDILNDMPSNNIIVSALGLNEGKIIEQQEVKLSTISNETIQKKGSRIAVPFELPIKKISEFQLKCTWGPNLPDGLKSESLEDNLEAPTPEKPSLGPTLNHDELGETFERKITKEAVILDSIEVIEDEMDCPPPQCRNGKEKKVSIRALVKNLSDKPISNLILSFGLFWASDGKIADLPRDLEAKRPGEEELSFGSLLIPQGGSVPFKVKIDRAIIDVSGGSFRPHIRVLSYK